MTREEKSMSNERNSEKDLTRDKYLTRLMIGVQIIMILVLAIIITLLTRNVILSTLTAIIVWALVLYKTPVFEWCFIIVKPNWSVILGNQTTYDVIDPDRNKRIEMNNLKSLREVGPGIRGKLPWETAFESIDLRSEIIIGNSDSNKPLECYTEDGIQLDITWQVVLTPLRGYLTNLVRKNEDAVKAYFSGQFEQAILGWVRKNKEETVFALLKNLEEEFKNVFGGPNVVSDTEADYGIFTNTPQIIRVTRSKRYQQAAEAVMVSSNMATIIGQLKDELGDGIDKNMLLATVAGLTGNEVKGLLLIPGVSGDAKAIAAVAAAVTNSGTKTTSK